MEINLRKNFTYIKVKSISFNKYLIYLFNLFNTKVNIYQCIQTFFHNKQLPKINNTYKINQNHI